MSSEKAIIKKDWSLYNGDCLTVLKKLRSNKEKFDAVITDPPYHLTTVVKRFSKTSVGDKNKTGKRAKNKSDGYARFSRGFMGQSWDGGDVAFDPKTWRKVYRVMKPGAYLVCFGGTRTFHRVAVAIEDAGFEIRDCFMWVYGCVDKDTEILTNKGWKKYYEVDLETVAASWNKDTGIISFDKIEDYCVYDYKGLMFNFKHSNTDQLLTPNHRVYYKKLKRIQIKGKRISYYDDNFSINYASSIKLNTGGVKFPVSGVLDNLSTLKGGKDMAALLGWIWSDGSMDKKGSGIRIYQSSSVNNKYCKQIEKLLIRLNIKYKTYTRTRTGYRGPTKSNNSHIHKEKTFFFTGEIASYIRKIMPNKKLTYKLAFKLNMQERRAFIKAIAFIKAAKKGDGSKDKNCIYQENKKSMNVLQALLTISGYRSRYTGRLDRKGQYTIFFEKNTVVELQSKHNKNTLIPYEDKVWCISTKNSTFIARRNNKVFITGNSGFPKNYDISKAIDKKLGKKRKIIGSRKSMGNIPNNRLRWGLKANTTVLITAPKSKQAKKWDGWGTAVKPAWEPIIIAKKPISEKTIVDNVLKHGTGAININASRVKTKDKLKVGKGNSPASSRVIKRRERANYELPSNGRWPANLIHDGSEEVLSSFPNTKDSASRFFYCAKTSRKELNGSIHPTVKPIALMRYLVKMFVQPDGKVLDPFAGSGTTLQAAYDNGVKSVGIEREKQYIKDIRTRMKVARKSLKNPHK